MNSEKINSGLSSEMPRYSACCAATARAMWLGSKARQAIVHARLFPGNRAGGTEGWLCQASLYQWGLLGLNSPGHSKGWKGNSSDPQIEKKMVNLKFGNGKRTYDGGRGLCQDAEWRTSLFFMHSTNQTDSGLPVTNRWLQVIGRRSSRLWAESIELTATGPIVAYLNT